MPTPEPLLPVFQRFQELAALAVDDEPADAMLGKHERILSSGAITTPDDLFAKARYLQTCGRIDPALIPMEALDTLVVGIVRLLGPALSQTPSATA